MSDLLKAAARKKPGKIIYPVAYKRKYFLSLKKELDELYQQIKKLDLNSLQETNNASLIMDSKSFIDMVLDFFIGLEKSTHENKYIKKTISYIAEKTDLFNKKNIQDSLFDKKAVSEIPPKKIEKIFNPLKDEAKDRVIKDFTSRNLDLIVTVKRDLVDKSKNVVINEIQAGNSPAMISEKLESAYNVSLNRAQFIAEDQVNKYVGDLSRARHTALGLKRYVWRTMEDSVVRKRCQGLKGKIFLYSEPPPGGHPTKQPNCRCWEQPVINDLWSDNDDVS